MASSVYRFHITNQPTEVTLKLLGMALKVLGIVVLAGLLMDVAPWAEGLLVLAAVIAAVLVVRADLRRAP